MEAKTEDEAIQKIENNPYDTMQKSYDGDYTRDDDGYILYTLNDIRRMQDD